MKKPSPSIAKITAPSASGACSRERLFRRLDDQGRPVTWISGPPGSGKTTLVASYLASRKLPFLWYQMDESDNDIASFFYYLGLAAKKAAPRYRKPLPLLTPEYLAGIPTFTLRYFENLSKRLPSSSALVFDNYQAISPDSKLHDILTTGLSALPGAMRVLFISRHEMPPTLSQLRVSGKIEALEWSDIRFTLEESGDLILCKKMLSPAPEALSLLHSKTDGWAAGLLLLIENAGAAGPDQRIPSDPVPEEIFRYFGGEILDKLSSEARDFLLMISFLPRFTAATAERMTDQGNAAQILSDLAKNNFFTELLPGPEPAYRFHPLFREFLQKRITMSMSPEGVVRTRKKAAQLLTSDGYWEEAVPLLCLARDWGGLIQLILSNAQQLIASGRHMTLAQWIESVPKDLRAQAPWLLYWHAVCRMPFNLTECREKLESAFELFRKNDDRIGLFLSCSGILDTYAIAFSDFTQADRWINEFEDILKRSGGFPSPDLEIRATFVMFLILSMRQPDHPRFSSWYEKARSLIRSCGDNSQRVINATFLLHYYSWIGFPADTPSLMKDLRLSIEAPDVPPAIKIMGLMVEAIHGWNTASFEAARKAVAEALELARYHGIHHYEGKLYAQEVYRATITGDCEASSDLVQKLAASTNFGNPLDSAHYHLLASFDARCRGDIAASLEHARASEKSAAAGGAPFPCAISRHNLSHALFESDTIPEARVYLERALRTARMMKSALLEFSCLLLEALFAFTAQDPESDKQGLMTLRSALSLGRTHAIMNISGWRRSTLARLCARALDEGIEPGFVHRLVRAHNLAPDDPAQAGDNWPWPMKIHTLGRFGLVLHGTPFHESGKSRKKPLNMLKLLVAAGPKGMSREQLVDELWPDAEGDDGNAAFRTTLSRLRDMIGNDQAVQFFEGTLSLDQRFCRVDAWVFEQQCNSVTEALQNNRDDKTDNDRIREMSGRAIKLYAGSFLATDIDLAMAIPFRERLRRKYIRLISDAGRLAENTGDFERARDYYASGLDADPLAEELYQGLMTCNRKLGRKAEAMAAYQRCADALKTGLGITPSRKTDLLKQEILES